MARIEGPMFEYACHEGNYGLPALLVGRRMDEAAFAEGRGPNPFSMDTFVALNTYQMKFI